MYLSAICGLGFAARQLDALGVSSIVSLDSHALSVASRQCSGEKIDLKAPAT